MTGQSVVARADAHHLPIASSSIDLIIMSPPYFALRAYEDGGKPYDGQVGSEPSPQEFIAKLLAVTQECVRVLKPEGSLWVNLGDKYAERAGPHREGGVDTDEYVRRPAARPRRQSYGFRPKSLMGLPWRYAIACIDDLGLILRAEVVWDKPNGMPESVTDRVRRSHEQWFHLTPGPCYFSAIDEIREPYAPGTAARYAARYAAGYNARELDNQRQSVNTKLGGDTYDENPLGKTPGSVWRIATQPLDVPAELEADHFAAFPPEWPRRLIEGFSPTGICTVCGQGRRPVSRTTRTFDGQDTDPGEGSLWGLGGKITARNRGVGNYRFGSRTEITGYSCGCPTADAPTRPAVVLDPFGGTGTTAMVARALGRVGISLDLSADYCRIGQWRTNDPAQRAKVRGESFRRPEPQLDGQATLFG